jgi:hypothetical protein
MTEVVDPLDADRAAEAGATFGQIATRPAWGGLVVASARFVEHGVRSTVLLVPGLFRVDLCPSPETLGLQLRELSSHKTTWQATPDTWDLLRKADTHDPITLRGEFELPGRTLAADLRLIMIGDTEAGGAYLSARAAVGDAPEAG